jgi:hypothetical protein
MLSIAQQPGDRTSGAKVYDLSLPARMPLPAPEHRREAQAALNLFEDADDRGHPDWGMGLRALVHALLALGARIERGVSN